MHSPITLEALHILDAIDRRGSFAAAANELDRAPSSLSYQIQKLEQDLDIIIFDRSGHKAHFTEAGKLILERGRDILKASEKLVNDATVLANGWELDITVAFDGIIPVCNFFLWWMRYLKSVLPESDCKKRFWQVVGNRSTQAVLIY